MSHPLLKCLVQRALADAYFARAAWEPREELEGRAAALLSGLLLPRIDGKSPVEYLAHEHDKALVRVLARQFLLRGPRDLAAIANEWRGMIRYAAAR